ncbi:TolC family protein [bacterium]|nr:TolC family protein [bacterium]
MDRDLKVVCGATHLLIFILFPLFFVQTGCQTPSKHRLKADTAAMNIIKEKQKQALGEADEEQDFTIERASDILRNRLLIDQNLPYACEASLGSDRLKPVDRWPEKDYPAFIPSADPNMPSSIGKTLKLSLMQALQTGAKNSFEYQYRKEEIFRNALALDLERNEFRTTFTGQVESLISADSTGESTVTGTQNSGSIGLGRRLKSGAQLTTALAVDLANLLTLGGASSLGIMADATVSIPLLRGAGRHIVMEPLVQAERNVIYAIYEFERFRGIFAVEIADAYLSVLKQLDESKNAEENYRSLIAASRRARRLADAGRMTEIDVDKAAQDELKARNRWIFAMGAYHDRLDDFKNKLGLPPDAAIELDKAELENLVAPVIKNLSEDTQKENRQSSGDIPPADAPVILIPPDMDDAGRFEIDESMAIRLALENRFDMRVAQGKVYDAQRKMVVLADALGADLTLFGKAQTGGRRTVASASMEDASLRSDKGIYSAILSLDLPFERTAERNAYREGIITLERAVRDVQILEDQIKLSVRNKLRDLVELRENIRIQYKSVSVAEKRVRSINMFIEAGRAEIRDLLEAQDALLSAQNGLTASIINYRIAELELQSDMGILMMDKKGLLEGFSLEEIDDAEDK